MNFTVEQLKEIVTEAKDEARVAADRYFTQRLKGEDEYPCGFAWVNIIAHDGKKIKGSTHLGRLLKKIGVNQDYQRVFQIWNPSDHSCQNVDTKEAGAQAAAAVFKRYGFTACSGSRWD